MNSAINLGVRTAAILTRPITNQVVYRVKSGIAAGFRRKGGLGFISRADSEEEVFVKQLDLKGKIIYEAGCYEGLYTMFFASQAKTVIAWEPHPVNQKIIDRNVKLNGFRNVRVRPAALSNSPGSAMLTYPIFEPARASIESAISEEIRHEPLWSRQTKVDVTTIDRDVQEQNLPAPEVIKIDVEGAEYPLLQGAIETLRKHRPVLLIEVHRAGGSARENGENIARLLTDLGYSMTQIESGEPLIPGKVQTKVGHLYCVSTKEDAKNRR